MNELYILSSRLKEAQTVTVLTGAGVSTESGIPDFRSSNGVWTKDIERTNVISKSYFEYRPKDFWKYYKDIFQIKLMGDYLPNRTHTILKELEEAGKDIRIFTQNIDGLHQKAGSSKVYEMHGSINMATCPKCKNKYDLKHILLEEVPRCTKVNGKGRICNFILKPDVVLFGDTVKYYQECLESIYESEVFLVMGTSLEVYPVNQLPKYVSGATKIHKVIVNKEKTEMDHYFQVKIHENLNHIWMQIEEDLV